MYSAEEGLYRLLEKLLRASDAPANCNELYDNVEVRKLATSPNRVSDYLGNMWRRAQVSRVPDACAGRGPRWRYLWRDKVPLSLGAIGYVPKSFIDRPNMMISEEGGQLQIDLREIVLIIKTRPKPKRAHAHT